VELHILTGFIFSIYFDGDLRLTVIRSLINNFYSSKNIVRIKDDGMGRTGHIERMEVHTKFWSENLREGNNQEYLYADGRTLKWIPKKWDVRV
jgi:hypothetical protein